MNPAQLLNHFDRIAEAPDAVPRLRGFILDLAVRGKLVEQNPNDEPACALLKPHSTIAAQQLRSLARKSERVLFALPDGWSWSRVGLIAIKTGSGSTPRGGRSVYRSHGVPFLRSQNIYNDGLRLDDVAYIDHETHARMHGTSIAPGDLLLNITGGSIGRCARVPDSPIDANLSQHVAIIRVAHSGMRDFIHRVILSPFFQSFVVEQQTGAGRGGLPKSRMDQIPVPIPPLAEQHRIVAKVDELMALCDQLEAAESKREQRRDRLVAASLNRINQPVPSADGGAATVFREHARFHLDHLPRLTTSPEHIKSLRQTILSLAVRGELVPQDINEEPALTTLRHIEKKRGGRDWLNNANRNIAEAFPSPRGWAWARIANAVERVTVGFVGSMKQHYVAQGIPFLRSQNVRANRFRAEGMVYISQAFHNSIMKSALSPGDVVVVRSGNVGTACAIPPSLLEANCSDLVVVKRPLALVPEFLCFYMNSLAAVHVEEGTVGVALTHFNTKSVATMPIAIPPLAEQQRIVAKVDELMTVCDQLEAQLTATQTDSRHLLEAVLSEALAPAAARSLTA